MDDEFDMGRFLLGAAVGLVVCGGPADVRGADPAESDGTEKPRTVGEAQRRARESGDDVDKFRLRGHFVQLEFRVGRSFAPGVGYNFAGSTRTLSTKGWHTNRWWAVGSHLTAHTVNFQSLDAFEVGAHGRISIGLLGGLGFEAAAGLARTSSRFQGTGLAGTFFPLGNVVEFGYSYQIPLGPFDRPRWLSAHQFSVRVNLPIDRWQTNKENEN